MSNKVDLKDKIVDGQYISPVLPDNVKNYLIDIDGTICDDIPNEEPERMSTAGHYPDALETLNKWYREGHIITFFTSRVEILLKSGYIKMALNIMDYLWVSLEEEIITGLIIT